MRASLVRKTVHALDSNLKHNHFFAEEFAIYLNYVRKLGFEETPDYDFLRDLFAKVMKNNGDVDGYATLPPSISLQARPHDQSSRRGRP